MPLYHYNTKTNQVERCLRMISCEYGDLNDMHGEPLEIYWQHHRRPDWVKGRRPMMENLFTQRILWVNKEGVAIPLALMACEYKRNVYRFVERRGKMWCDRVGAAIALGSLAPEGPDFLGQHLAEVHRRGPERWVLHTALMRELWSQYHNPQWDGPLN